MPRQPLNDIVLRQTGGVVQTGPFKGMRLCPEASWGDGDLAAKVLGVYEQELHPALLAFSAGGYDEVVDVGSAEGYYAVGAALLFRGLRVRAFDASERSHAILAENAALNGVADRVGFGGLCDPAALEAIAEGRRLLAIIDCEGGEDELFASASTVASLRRSDLIIECHDFVRRGITGDLVGKFFATHLIEVLYSSGRNPNAFPFLADMSDAQRFEVICENRPELMNWLICRSKFPAG